MTIVKKAEAKPSAFLLFGVRLLQTSKPFENIFLRTKRLYCIS